jgi:hypothetical protein
MRIILDARGKSESIEVGQVMGDGASALASISTNGRYIIKTALPGENLAKFVSVACREKLLLEYLSTSGMTSEVPKMFSLANSHGGWDQALLVLENVGPII